MTSRKPGAVVLVLALVLFAFAVWFAVHTITSGGPSDEAERVAQQEFTRRYPNAGGADVQRWKRLPSCEMFELSGKRDPAAVLVLTVDPTRVLQVSDDTPRTAPYWDFDASDEDLAARCQPR